MAFENPVHIDYFKSQNLKSLHEVFISVGVVIFLLYYRL